MNRRSFFWFLPALPAVLIARPVLADESVRLTFKPAKVRRWKALHPGVPAEFIDVTTLDQHGRYSSGNLLTIDGVRGLERVSGHTFKIT